MKLLYKGRQVEIGLDGYIREISSEVDRLAYAAFLDLSFMGTGEYEPPLRFDYRRLWMLTGYCWPVLHEGRPCLVVK